MHTFRDAIDVNYQRMAITGEELSGVSTTVDYGSIPVGSQIAIKSIHRFQVPLEDLHMAATHLAEALRLRKVFGSQSING